MQSIVKIEKIKREAACSTLNSDNLNIKLKVKDEDSRTHSEYV